MNKKNKNKLNFTSTISKIIQKNVLNGSWKWLNDKRVTSFMDKGHKNHTLKDQLDYFKKINNSNKDILLQYIIIKLTLGTLDYIK